MDGIVAAGGQAYFTIEGSSVVNNLGVGVHVVTAGIILNVGNSTVGGNGTGVKADAGQLVSFANNQFSANGSDGSFTSTKALK